MYTFNSISYLVLLSHFFNRLISIFSEFRLIFLSFLRDFDYYLEKEKKILLQITNYRERVVISSESRDATVRDT